MDDVAETDVCPRAETNKPKHKYRNVFHEPQSGKETRLRLGPQIGQVSTSADWHTLNRFQLVGTYFNI